MIIVDSTKLLAKLGERWRVPIEVLAFAHPQTEAQLARIAPAVLRQRDVVPWRTDAGNFIYDLAYGVIADPGVLNNRIRAIPGVVESGLFVQRADVVIVAKPDGEVCRLRRAPL